jgi:hypothetical protein
MISYATQRRDKILALNSREGGDAPTVTRCTPTKSSASGGCLEPRGKVQSTYERKSLPNDRGASARLTRGPECMALTSGRLE